MQQCFRTWALAELRTLVDNGADASAATVDVGKKKINKIFPSWCDTAWSKVPKNRILNGLEKIGVLFIASLFISYD
jgi:hypothetical protein